MMVSRSAHAVDGLTKAMCFLAGDVHVQGDVSLALAADCAEALRTAAAAVERL